LVFALERLNERGLLSERLSLLIGQNSKISTQKKMFIIAVGECASKKHEADLLIDECPPTAGTIYQCIASTIREQKYEEAGG
jgi:hypothetical protein